MIAKCANPACSREFRYLHEGRLFAVERYERTASDGNYTSEFVSHPHAIEFYWLCNDCYSRGTLTMAAEEVTARFIPKPVVQSRADSDAVAENTFEEEAA